MKKMMKCKICKTRTATTGDQHLWFCQSCYTKVMEVAEVVNASKNKEPFNQAEYLFGKDKWRKYGHWVKANDWKEKEKKIFDSIWDKEVRVYDTSEQKKKRLLKSCTACGSMDFYRKGAKIECKVCHKRYLTNSWRLHKLLNIEEIKVRISKPGPPLPTLQRMLRPIG